MDTAKAAGQQYVVDPLLAAFTSWAWRPILSSLGILLLGWIIALVLERIVNSVLKTLTVDKLSDRVGLSGVLAKGGIRRKLSELIGAIVYWLVMLAFVITALNALGLSGTAKLFEDVVAFLPRVLAAVFILIIGVFSAAFLATTVRTAASNAGVRASHMLGQLVQTILIILATVAALQQLEIQFVGDAFLIILGGVSLGCALAFGLGCKELAGRWVSELVDELKSHKRS
jgi:hypothetical protein